MPRRFPWRVRVSRLLESWVDVEAYTASEAHAEAWNFPGVRNVFPGSAIRTDEVSDAERPVGVRDE